MKPILAEVMQSRIKSPIIPGSQIAGQYKMVREIGRGSMGVVWLARDLFAERNVCIKLLPQEQTVQDQDIERMRTTFRLIHRVQHQHLCPHLLFAVDPQFGPFLVLKYFRGCALSDQCLSQAGGRHLFQPADVTRTLFPVADGLDHLHRMGLVHRDIKPGNIMVGRRSCDVQIVDFGMVEKYSVLRTLQTRPPSPGIAGSGGYLAPEIWKGCSATPETDQYALATIAYELLAGQRPFFQCQSVAALMRSVLMETVPPINDLTDIMNEALMRGLSKEPQDRFSSCRDFVRALRNALPQLQASDSLLMANMDATIMLTDQPMA